ncbi:MAG: hypothetical protein OEN01_13735 [Candidatus Krumholzibacteria bacterium]|nr:hypothetical protein [Candidatus Krumholzibacteria bacterium]
MRTYRRLVVILLSLVVVSACSGGSDDNETLTQFDEHLKTGDLSIAIVGDYFHHSYVLELVHVARALSPHARQFYVCTEKYERALDPFLAANDVQNVEYRTLEPSSPILTQWARDIAIAGTADGKTTIVVSPDKHANSKRDAEAIGDLLRDIFPEYAVHIAPFVFESGNMVFVRSGGDRVLIVGRKILFDNSTYQRQAWTRGYTEASLLGAMAETFAVDRVLVVGRALAPPDTRMYFEYHIDMGMAVLGGGRAVVSRLEFGENERTALASAIDARHPVVTPFVGLDPERLLATLSTRLGTVAMEYEDYATLLDSLGVEVYRSPVGWQHVLGSMSWTNVVQVGERILMPLYPDSLLGITKFVASAGGQMRITLDVSDIGEEKFELRDLNQRNRQLYQSLGYEVVTVPEYLHYMMGGIHCFVNVLE